MAKVAIIGAGAMGLAAAFHALRAGHDVTVWEAEPVAGGQAAHFEFGGVSIERFYHFVCKDDRPTFDLLSDLGIAGRLRWVSTSMGYFVHGRHHRWGDPGALLRFPHLGLLSKLRYGAHVFGASRRTAWQALDDIPAVEWLRRGCGEAAYDLLWRRTMELKFFEHTPEISAAWMWSRIRRVGRSRRSIFQEELGHLDGGSETLVKALVTAIESLGGRLRLGARVEEIRCAEGRVTGIHADGTTTPVDQVIATVPTPFVPALLPALPEPERAAYAAIENIPVICVVLKLRRSVTPHFWLNVNDPEIDVPGIIEFSNLRPLPQPVIYAPFYMPASHPKFHWSDAQFIEAVTGYLQRLNPAISASDVIDGRVGRLRHAQPICGLGFSRRIPPVVPSIRGLQIADTCYYYPEDRGIAESVRFGKRLAQGVDDPSIWQRARPA